MLLNERYDEKIRQLEARIAELEAKTNKESCK